MINTLRMSVRLGMVPPNLDAVVGPKSGSVNLTEVTLLN
jgi:hypothetical protein